VCLSLCTGGNEVHSVLARSSIMKTAGSVREEPKAEHHLRVEKVCDSLRSYLFMVLGPHMGFTLRTGTNEDLLEPCMVLDTSVKILVH
jgi:hypothetical protein